MRNFAVMTALLMLLACSALPDGYGDEVAIEVGQSTYTRNDLVDLIILEQRLSALRAEPFDLGSALFDVLQQIRDSELAYYALLESGVTFPPNRVDERIALRLGLDLADSADTWPTDDRRRFDDELKRFVNKVGLAENTWREFIEKSLYLDALTASATDSPNEDEVQDRLEAEQVRSSVNITLNSTIADWIKTQVRSRTN